MLVLSRSLTRHRRARARCETVCDGFCTSSSKGNVRILASHIRKMIVSHAKAGREQRRLLAQDLEAEQYRQIASRLEGVVSPPPDSDASSGGHRLMYRRSLLVGTGAGDADEDISDRRSSSSSLGWMMKSPLRVAMTEDTLAEELKPSLVDTKPEANHTAVA